MSQILFRWFNAVSLKDLYIGQQAEVAAID